MPRRSYPIGPALPSNPYPSMRPIQPNNTLCQTCDRTILSKDWPAHQTSKRHRQALEGKQDENTAPLTVDTGFDNMRDAGSAPSNVHDKSARTEFRGECYICHQMGHSKANCPDRQPRRACYLCNEPGHVKADCPNAAKAGSGGGSGQCHNCGQYGHRKADCQNERQFICRNCDAIGHMSRDCPKPRDWSRVECRNCGQKGHGEKRCPNAARQDSGHAGTPADTGMDGDAGAAPSIEPVGDWADQGANEGAADDVGGW